MKKTASTKLETPIHKQYKTNSNYSSKYNMSRKKSLGFRKRNYSMGAQLNRMSFDKELIRDVVREELRRQKTLDKENFY